MDTPHRVSARRALRSIALGVTALALVVPLPSSQAVEGKRFAAYEYGWYPINHVDHFVGSLPSYYSSYGTEGPNASVGTQNGMLTITSGRTGATGTVLREHAHDRGRWEIRLRGMRFEDDFTDFTVAAELIPAGKRAYNCGARNIGFASYRPTGSRNRTYARTLPDHAFNAVRRRMNFSNNYWHTFGVEVTPTRISWFSDGRVRRTETRPDALSGVPLALRLELTDVPGETMNLSRLQVDTVRYFTLQSPNDKSVEAPAPNRTTYAGACADD